ncbi:hypothetical protein [Amycolatopsis japonica]
MSTSTLPPSLLAPQPLDDEQRQLREAVDLLGYDDSSTRHVVDTGTVAGAEGGNALPDRDVLVVPDILADTGGVVVSCCRRGPRFPAARDSGESRCGYRRPCRSSIPSRSLTQPEPLPVAPARERRGGPL